MTRLNETLLEMLGFDNVDLKPPTGAFTSVACTLPWTHGNAVHWERNIGHYPMTSNISPFGNPRDGSDSLGVSRGLQLAL